MRYLALHILAVIFATAMAGSMARARSVLGGPLKCCCTRPQTGYYRDGFCNTGPNDVGAHVVCARVTLEFLEFSRSRGNDLMAAHPPFFPGLQPGDRIIPTAMARKWCRWCLCASRWKEALDAGVAPPVYLDGCHEKALEFVSMAQLQGHALQGDAAFEGGSQAETLRSHDEV